MKLWPELGQHRVRARSVLLHEPETVTGEWTLLPLGQHRVNLKKQKERNNNSNEMGETEADRLTNTAQRERERQTDRARESEKHSQ